MKVFIVGGDGFVGWPLALNLSIQGYRVIIVDNFLRRSIDVKNNTGSLTPIKSLGERLKAWKKITGRSVLLKRVDVAKNYYGMVDIIKKTKPDAIINLAKQRSVPYSMKNPHTKRYTMFNNNSATHNIMCAIASTGMDIHLVNVGSIGIYGYDVRRQPVPNDMYHVTEANSLTLSQFYSKIERIRISEVYQGIIWGIETRETSKDIDLINRYDYCGNFGTVVNRFIAQAVLNGPITVYGTGSQSRAVLHITNALEGIKQALEAPGDRYDDILIHNQYTELIGISDLAKRVSNLNNCPIEYIESIRPDVKGNHPEIQNGEFTSNLGEKYLINKTNLSEVFELAKKHIKRLDEEIIECQTKWGLSHKSKGGSNDSNSMRNAS